MNKKERQQLAKRRAQLGVSLRALAPMIDISWNTLCRWEKGVPQTLPAFKVRAWTEALDRMEHELEQQAR